MRLTATCKQMHNVLGSSLRERAEGRRLQWEQDGFTTGHTITNQGRTITRLGGKWTKAWACCNVLPTSGRVSWRVRIDRCMANEGVLCVGVCDAEGRHAYGIAPYSGKLSSLYRSCVGAEIEANETPPQAHVQCGFLRQVMLDAQGHAANLKGRANGALIEITYDADAGSVAFRVNRGTAVEAIRNLPPGVALRPWARLFDVPDRVTISGCWTVEGGETPSYRRMAPMDYWPVGKV